MPERELCFSTGLGRGACRRERRKDAAVDTESRKRPSRCSTRKRRTSKRNLEVGSDRCGLRKELPSVRRLSGFEKIWVSQEIRIERIRRGSCDSARVSKGICGFSTKRAPSRKRRSRSMRRAISLNRDRVSSKRKTRSQARASKGASCPRASEPPKGDLVCVDCSKGERAWPPQEAVMFEERKLSGREHVRPDARSERRSRSVVGECRGEHTQDIARAAR